MFRATNNGDLKRIHTKCIDAFGNRQEDRNVKNGNFYTYQFMMMMMPDYANEIYYPTRKSQKITVCYLNSPYGKKIVNSNGGKTMTMSWNRNTKADGYQVCYTIKKPRGNSLQLWENCKKITRKVKGSSNTKLVLNNRTPNKQYWVRLRSYKIRNGKTYYGSWSATYSRYTK